MRRRAILILLPGMMTFGPATANSQPVSLFAPGHYQVDSAATKAHFHVKALIGGYEGDFVAPEGSVTIDESHPGRAVIDIRFPVDRLTTGDESTDAMLKGASFFDVKHFPTVEFTATDAPIVTTSAATPVAGQLTMHGQSRPVTISVRLTDTTAGDAEHGAALHFSGNLTIDRSQFGMGFGTPFLSDRVNLTVEAFFCRS